MVKKAMKKKAAKKKVVTKKAVAKKTAKKAGTKKTAKKTVKKAAGKVKRTPKTASRKSAQVKKNTKKKVLRRRPKTRLSKTEINHFRELLVEKLKEILGNVNHIEIESLKNSRIDASGDLSSMPIHMADVGSDNYEQEFALGLMDGERKIVQEIFAALSRIENGTYGICEGTGEPIPKARLEGIPWTRYCVRYAEMLEKGLVSEEDRLFSDDQDYQEDFDEESDEESGYDLDDDEDDDEEDENEPFYYQFSDDDMEDDDE